MKHARLGGWILAGLSALALVLAFGASLDPGRGTPAEESAWHASRNGERLPVGPPILLPPRGAPETGETLTANDDDVGHAPGVTTPDEDPDDSRASPRDADDTYLRNGLPLTASHPQVAPVIEVQNRYTRELMKHPLVVGTATGMNERGEIAIVLLTTAETSDLPAYIDRIPVVVHVSGELFASKGPPSGHGGGNNKDQPTIDRTARFDRPVPIGVSTGHVDITAGTIGCRVVDGSGALFALSNNHVYADENLASLTDPVIQPGTYDGGTTPADDIGTLYDYEPLDFTTVGAGGANVMDAAIVSTDETLVGAATPDDGYGLPKTTTIEPAINLRVRKYGRTTGETTGKIFAINANVNVGYSSGTAGFVGQIIITGGTFSAGGDSGSLVVGQKGQDARKPVGLLFAGSASTTVVCPIDPILDRFGVTVDGE